MFDYRIINNNPEIQDAFLEECLYEAAKHLNESRAALIKQRNELDPNKKRLLVFLNQTLTEIDTEIADLNNSLNNKFNFRR